MSDDENTTERHGNMTPPTAPETRLVKAIMLIVTALRTMPRLPRKCSSTNTNLFARCTVIKNTDSTSNTFFGAMNCKREIEIEISKNHQVSNQ